MRSRIAALCAALFLPLGALSACGGGGPDVVEIVTTTVEASTSSSSSSSSSSPTSPAPSPEATASTAAAPSPASAQCDAYGYTGAPGTENARCLDKQIASCGDSSIHQMGTTFFTDGSSGWTQTCQNAMAATYVPPAPEPTFDQDAYNQQFAEEYWRNNPRPTFDPDSADGYGPDQKLPPACLRFENVDC